MLTNKHKAQLIIMTAFIAGIIVGASGQYLVLHKSLGKPNNPNQEMLDDLTKSVKLTSDQRVQVEQFLADSRQQYQELRNQNRPQYNAIRDATRKRISSILSTDQQTLYEKWTHELDARREKEKAASSSTTGK